VAGLIFWGVADSGVTVLPWIGAGVGLLLAGLHAARVLRSKNADLQANRARAQQETAAGTVVVDRPGISTVPREVPGGSGPNAGQIIALVVMAAGALVIAAPELARALGGWPVNAGFYPPVIGPGDTARAYFPRTVIYSIKSYWRGSATARVANAAAIGLAVPQVQARTNEDSWGDRISLKRSEENGSSKLWVDLTMPDKPELAGKTLDLELSVNVQFPAGGGGSFHNAQNTYQPKARVQLASTRAGFTYQALLLFGSLGGAVLIVLAGFALKVFAEHMKKEARPTKLFAVQ
jgi:hypothetical protein